MQVLAHPDSLCSLFGLFHMLCSFLESVHMLIHASTSTSHACLISCARLGFSSYTMSFIHMPIRQCHKCCVGERYVKSKSCIRNVHAFMFWFYFDDMMKHA